MKRVQDHQRAGRTGQFGRAEVAVRDAQGVQEVAEVGRARRLRGGPPGSGRVAEVAAVLVPAGHAGPRRLPRLVGAAPEVDDERVRPLEGIDVVKWRDSISYTCRTTSHSAPQPRGEMSRTGAVVWRSIHTISSAQEPDRPDRSPAGDRPGRSSAAPGRGRGSRALPRSRARSDRPARRSVSSQSPPSPVHSTPDKRAGALASIAGAAGLLPYR